MIKKNYRLDEKEVKKVLRFWKPFFSYWIVASFIKNDLNCNRFAIVLSGKTVKTSISRNFFRRKFFDFTRPFLSSSQGKDIVFMVKKQTKLDKKEGDSLQGFEKDVQFLLKKVI